ncbi:MAG: hypothetical protein JWP47_2117 [Polaromonas sp.]|jgi:hypothetical protein|nr:hypothetical protein [Polaromonas sp.]
MNRDASAAKTGVVKSPGNEEPEPVTEPDLPSDGRDEQGEKMIRELPRNPDLSEPTAADGVQPS